MIDAHPTCWRFSLAIHLRASVMKPCDVQI